MRPNNVNEALEMVHTRLFAAGFALEQYLLNSQDLSHEVREDLEDAKAAVLDSHLLVTWIKDNK
jgi:hypothetical protein